jgi:hypothetical protein
MIYNSELSWSVEEKMKVDKIIVGESYRHKDHAECWAKVIKVLKPNENKRYRYIVKCEWSSEKNSNFGVIKYFKPSELIDNKVKT